MSSVLTDRFDQALLLASQLHHDQKRKRTEIPYLSHLLRVAGLVLEFGADEDTAIAALLHDAVEDQGGIPVAEMIGGMFGNRVKLFVLECSDSTTENDFPKLPWRFRKENYIRHLLIASPEALLISAADKLDNMCSTLRKVRICGDAAFEIFKTGKEDQKWYYREVLKIQKDRQSPIYPELADVFEKIYGEEP